MISTNASTPSETHTVAEFISVGQSLGLYYSYKDFSFIEVVNGAQYVVKNILDDYIVDLKDMAIEVKISEKDKEKYKYNPKLLSYKLYKTVDLYWVILRINDMINVHEFNLSNKNKILLIRPNALKGALQKIYNAEKFAIATFNSNHETNKIA